MRQSFKTGLAIAGVGVFAVLAFGPGLLNGQKAPTVEKDGGIKAPEMKKEKGQEEFEVKSVAVYQGKVLIGTKEDVLEVAGDKLSPWGEYPGHEVKSLFVTKGGALLVGDKHKLWRFEGGTWTQTGEWDAHGFVADDKGTIWMAGKKEGLFASDDEGKTWRSAGLQVPEQYKGVKKEHEEKKDEKKEKQDKD